MRHLIKKRTEWDILGIKVSYLEDDLTIAFWLQIKRECVQRDCPHKICGTLRNITRSLIIRIIVMNSKRIHFLNFIMIQCNPFKTQKDSIPMIRKLFYGNISFDFLRNYEIIKVVCEKGLSIGDVKGILFGFLRMFSKQKWTGERTYFGNVENEFFLNSPCHLG